VQVFHATCSTHLIPQAFPALHSLSLEYAQLGDGSLFSQLAAQPNSSLTSLQLACCSLDSAAVQHAAVALGQLTSLQALHLQGADLRVDTALAAHVTGLTSLTICDDDTGAVLGEQQVAVAVQNQGLRSLSLSSRLYSYHTLQPDLLQEVLSSCTALTQLTLTCGELDDQGLGVLLTHGTSITDLMLGNTSLTTSKADWPCSWRKLDLYEGTLQEFAYLPLKSVQQLEVRRQRLDTSWVQLALDSDTPAEQLPDLLHQATRNLASCPAWLKAPPSDLLLHGYVQDLTSVQRVQLLQALAPVAGMSPS
jgi:hypothetical protein